jgi:molybdopterin converting factor small subunit
MIVQLRLFAGARQAVGEATIAVTLPEAATVADLRQALVQQFPALLPLELHLLFAIDQEFAKDDQPVPDRGEVACFPPVSGG